MFLSESVGTLFRGYTKYRIQRYTAKIETAPALRVPDVVKLEILLHLHADNHIAVRDIQSADKRGTKKENSYFNTPRHSNARSKSYIRKIN